MDYTNPYTLVVAVALSAQATDIGVNKATKALFKVVSTPQEMLDLGEDKLKEFIKTIGLFNTKAKNVIKAARLLVEEFDGIVPENREDLEKLPGVGRKTANVVLNIAFGHPTIAVDTHLFRVSNRTKMAPGKTPLAVELKLMKKIPKEFARHAHQAALPARLKIYARLKIKHYFRTNPEGKLICRNQPVGHLTPSGFFLHLFQHIRPACRCYHLHKNKRERYKTDYRIARLPPAFQRVLKKDCPIYFQLLIYQGP